MRQSYKIYTSVPKRIILFIHTYNQTIYHLKKAVLPSKFTINRPGRHSRPPDGKKSTAAWYGSKDVNKYGNTRKPEKGKNVSRSFRNPEKEKQFVENRDHPDTDGFGSPDRTIPNQNRLSRHGIARIAKRSRFRRTPLPDETACRAKPEHDPDQRAAYPEGKKRDAENT